MASSLSTLASNLLTDNFTNYCEVAKLFQPGDLKLVTRKDVYPYDYTESWRQLEKEELPPREDFYSILNEKEITVDDYKHAKEVWDHFNCRTLGDYSDLYLKIDVLLANVFENFWDICISTCNLESRSSILLHGSGI